LSVVVIGGIVGRLQQTKALPDTAAAVSPVVEADMGLGITLPDLPTCRTSDASPSAPGAKLDTQATGGGRQVLSGAVRSSDGCAPIAGAKIEFWPAGSDTASGQEERATLYADRSGKYRLQCDLPAGDSGKYIYLRVSADGYATLMLQYKPQVHQTESEFDIVLQPGD
jgi:hypothetical protein